MTNLSEENIKAEIIILTIDNVPILKRCLESIEKNTLMPVRIFIVNNGGRAESGKYLTSLTDSDSVTYRIISHDRNIGFVKGNNEAMKLTASPYVCLLNDDTVVTRGWLSGMIKAAEKNSDIGIINPSSNTLGVLPGRGEDLNSFAERLRRVGEDIYDLGTASGFCMLIKRELIRKIGYFDEEIDMAFFEDSDYSLRAKEAGYRCVMTNQSYVFHYEHRSFSKVKRIESFFRKNREWFYHKWGKPLRIAMVINGEFSESTASLLSTTINSLTAQGNFVTLFTEKESVLDIKNRKIANCRILLRKKFFMLRLLFALMFRVKKPYDLLIVSDPALLRTLVYFKMFINKPLYFLVMHKDDTYDGVFSLADKLFFAVRSQEDETLQGFPAYRDKILLSRDIANLRRSFGNVRSLSSEHYTRRGNESGLF